MTSYNKLDQWDHIHCNWLMVKFILASHWLFYRMIFFWCHFTLSRVSHQFRLQFMLSSLFSYSNTRFTSFFLVSSFSFNHFSHFSVAKLLFFMSIRPLMHMWLSCSMNKVCLSIIHHVRKRNGYNKKCMSCINSHLILISFHTFSTDTTLNLRINLQFAGRMNQSCLYLLKCIKC